MNFIEAISSELHGFQGLELIRTHAPDPYSERHFILQEYEREKNLWSVKTTEYDESDEGDRYFATFFDGKTYGPRASFDEFGRVEDVFFDLGDGPDDGVVFIESYLQSLKCLLKGPVESVKKTIKIHKLIEEGYKIRVKKLKFNEYRVVDFYEYFKEVDDWLSRVKEFRNEHTLLGRYFLEIGSERGKYPPLASFEWLMKNQK